MAILVRKNQEFTDLLQKNLMAKNKHEGKRRLDNIVHVSDIIPTTCIRKQYYSRKEPSPLSNESVHHFVRGEASEFVITQLADMGVAQASLEMDGIIAHPDITNSDNEEGVIVELKDTVNGTCLNFYDSTFRGYLRQLLYYMVRV